jgi:hypothetical protein
MEFEIVYCPSRQIKRLIGHHADKWQYRDQWKWLSKVLDHAIQLSPENPKNGP